MNPTAPAPLDWADLYTEYQTKIYNYIYRRTSDQVLAEDLTADVFVKAIDSTERGNGHETSFSGWIYRIAHNLIIDHYRARDRHQQVSIDDVLHLPDPSNNPVKAAEHTEDIEVLRLVMERLTPQQAKVLALRFEHGYSYADVARETSQTELAAKSTQRRALNSAKAMLSDERFAENIPANRHRTLLLIRKCLCEHGPLTIGKIAENTGFSHSTIQGTFYRHPDIFCLMGNDKWYSRAYVYGLVGIHDLDKEAA
jgi:RNA polymerase sigma-70 factor (ECF subfamily)